MLVSPGQVDRKRQRLLEPSSGANCVPKDILACSWGQNQLREADAENEQRALLEGLEMI